MKSNVTQKPWGYEILWAHTQHYVGKIMVVNSQQALSLQYHERKDETFMLLHGDAVVELGQEGVTDNYTLRQVPMERLKSFHIPPRTVHRIVSGDIQAQIVEVSTDHLDDVVRLEDKYGR